MSPDHPEAMSRHHVLGRGGWSRRYFLGGAAMAPAVLLGTTARAHDGATTTVGDLLDRLASRITVVATTDVVRREWLALRDRLGVTAEELSLDDFARVRTVFELARSGGAWGLRWQITNEKPNSERIWDQWALLDESAASTRQPTAVAECDELSALFAFVVYRLGVRGVGLFWPEWNHVVAVWVLRGKLPRHEQVRMVIPTSQIWLSSSAGIGTTEFDAYSQKTIYEYRRADVSRSLVIPRSLADAFVEAVEPVSAMSSSALQALRTRRLRQLGGVDFGRVTTPGVATQPLAG